MFVTDFLLEQKYNGNQMSINRWTDTCNNMDKSQNYQVEWNKSYKNKSVLQDFMYVKF